MKSLPFVSIVIPVRNEEANLPRCLESIKKINYPKSRVEVIIVDGYSNDKTVEIAKSSGTRVFYNRQKIRSTGCQIGVNRAKGTIIAFTDADCVVPKNWLRDLLKHFGNDNVASVGGPNITPKDDTPFAKASGEAIWLLTRAGSRYGLIGGKVIETYHNPGCNVIYRKAIISQVGGLNPHLLTCEDEELDFRIREAGYKILFTPKVVVDHYRRPTYKRIYIQAYRFAIGRMQAIRMHPKMARWFHFVPSLLLASVVLAVGMLFVRSVIRDTGDAIRNAAMLYLLAIALAFLIPSLWLAVNKKTASYYTQNALIYNSKIVFWVHDYLTRVVTRVKWAYIYLAIFICWFSGWGLGFLSLFFNPQNREEKGRKSNLNSQYKKSHRKNRRPDR